MTINATANQATKNTSTAAADVKIATPDLILFKDSPLAIEIMTDLVFEDIGGQELINIIRNDVIFGQDVLYQPIKNVTSLYLQYNPNNILKLQSVIGSYFNNLPIKFENKIPRVGTGPNGETVYLEQATGNLIINVINMDKDEKVEVQILSQGTKLNDTIYGAV